MVFFNYATMQMAAKIVYYGPGLCGKTTNLHHIYTKTSPQSRGEMVSLETETDRTLFFDLLPIDVGVIGGFKTRLQLYTVPGQVFYNTTRKLVLKGVDGIVFVADSQRAMIDANVESFKNLRENLAEIGLDLDELPVVMQLNKRDLPNIATVEELANALDPERRHEYVESVASSGVGVFETLKLISKLTLRTLRRRMTGEEPVRQAPARTAQFRVQDHGASPARTLAGTTPTPVVASPAPAFDTGAVSVVEERAAVPAARIEEAPAFDPEATIAAASIDPRILAGAPVEAATPEVAMPPAEALAAPEPVIEEVSPSIAEVAPTEVATTIDEVAPNDEVAPIIEEPPAPIEQPIAASTIEAPAPEPEIEFSEMARPQKAEPEVKTVKVRSSVDVMAELEALRKRATQTTAKTPKRDVMADLASLRPKRDIHRTVNVQLPAEVLPRTKSVRVTLSFQGEDGTLQSHDQTVELGDTSDVQSVSVNLKIDMA
jgi:hypothetical protein